MFKLVLNGGLVFGLLLAGSPEAQAQVQQPTPQQLQRQAPAVPQVQIGEDDLRKFSNAIKQLQVIQQDTVTKVTQVVQSGGLSKERFIQISQAQQNPSDRSAAKITPEEQKNFEQASQKIGEIQRETQTKMIRVLGNQDLDIQRFNDILVTVRQNPELQQKVQQMMRS